jgi:multidrug efflux pump subunit AcrB
MTKMGISGNIARRFLTTQITPLLALVGVLIGIFAVLVTPREEDPQINVTFANVFIAFPGATASEVESLVSTPAEQVIAEISGIEHVYSTSMPGMSVLTVQFLVGENRTDAIVRLYNKLYSNQDWLPENLGVGQPIIKPKGIDDVPILSATLWSKQTDTGAYELSRVAHALETELKRIPGTRDIYTIGSPERVMHIVLDPQALSGYNIDINDLANALKAANTAHTGIKVTADNRELLLQAGTFLSNEDEIAELIVGVFGGKAVYLRDVATVRHGSDSPGQYVSIASGKASQTDEFQKHTFSSRPDVVNHPQPAVTLAIAKKPGTNAVDIANAVIKRLDEVRGTLIPDDIEITITRNYGKTAQEKSEKLIQKLIIETIAVIFLVMVMIGWREGLIVGAAVAVTLLITLFASWAYGFTLNRVSLFALIFSIGILVDDAIVVVENIHRHMGLDHGPERKSLVQLIPAAVDEVGGPTILATFTVIAALLPMAFVSGLMGPYMSPIPINASMGMLASLVVAFVFTPWLTNIMLSKRYAQSDGHEHNEHAAATGATGLFTKVMSPFLGGDRGNRNRWLLLGGIILLISAAISLAVFKVVVLKMLPSDNKGEFQVVLDMPEGTTLERTSQVLYEMGQYIGSVDEVTDYEIYAGTAAPISFNGLVRQYYLREAANVGDIQVNLLDKHYRDRQSHEIALSVRPPLQQIAEKYNANVKVVEVPPGPPVMSPIVAEVYGLDYEGQIQQAKALRTVFESTPNIVDVDDSVEYPAEKLTIAVDRQQASRLGVPQAKVAEALATVLTGSDVSFLHGKNLKYAVPIRVEYDDADKADIEQVLSLQVRSANGHLVPLSELVDIHHGSREKHLHHKDLLPVVYVTGDIAGDVDSPLYGMFEIASQLGEQGPEQWYTRQPDNPYEYSLKWDGEWQVTYETFRDMGAAYAVGLLMIYLLVVAQFHSYKIPLVIMAPIPLTIIGIMPGHALLGAQFTATSMIGMIALAGIIVRNSILLVDFINQQVDEGVDFEQAVINSAAVRAKPIILTGIAAMIGGFFIIDDPIFGGLAISLIFGLLVSTMLTLIVIPVVYYAVMYKKLARAGA